MDFPNPEQDYYDGIRFKISKLFTEEYNDNFVVSDDALIKTVYGLDLHFSLEKFDADDADLIRFSFDEEIASLDAIHDNYIIKREASLKSHTTSIKKELPENISYSGYIQVVDGKSNAYGTESSYFTATMEIEDNYYVFQLIGKKENMGYLYDDFIDILASVEK